MATKGAADFAAMMLDPYDHFETPMAVARSESLSKEEKLSVLKSMEEDARELQVAEEESMDGGERRSLSAVRDAMRAVDPEAAARSEAVQTSKAR
ncbi:hypothetical protein T8K17_22030 [Thalassobaculum sp. OXR-137]|uniref:hypothetical protein n=1 Tax=Thalassobaculum sp. OXR-137 TaxID=3100173 RepID=UPI002AC9BCD8|nr:hypothetical protein [Thalassobaculum sp. OXR-137]WPZ33905.1 hypothetical protein T8K17_22030 [Thalassobaculum sp. OXR-137]